MGFCRVNSSLFVARDSCVRTDKAELQYMFWMRAAEFENFSGWVTGNMKFWRKLGKSVSETLSLVKQMYGDEAQRSVLTKWNWQGNRSFFHTLRTHLISHHVISSRSPVDRKTIWTPLSVSRRDCHCYNRSHARYSFEYLSEMFLAAILTLADVHVNPEEMKDCNSSLSTFITFRRTSFFH